jgi:hypothetical protein
MSGDEFGPSGTLRREKSLASTLAEHLKAKGYLK